MLNKARPGNQGFNPKIVMAVVCDALGAVSAAMASLNVAIPGLVRSTHATQTQLEWIIDAYLLVFAVLLLPAGALGDHLRRRAGCAEQGRGVGREGDRRLQGLTPPPRPVAI